MAFLTIFVGHARTRAVTRDTVCPGNSTLDALAMRRARVVSDVSVLCPRVVVCFGNSGCNFAALDMGGWVMRDPARPGLPYRP